MSTSSDSLEGPASPDKEDDDFDSPVGSPQSNHQDEESSPKGEEVFDEGSSGSSPDAASSSFVPHKKFRRSTHSSSANLTSSSPKKPAKRKHSPTLSDSDDNLSNADSKSPADDYKPVTKAPKIESESGFEDTGVETSHETFSASFGSEPASFSQKNEYNPPQNVDRSSIGWKLMGKSGYQEGKGLGKGAQGRVEPVGLSTQRGRRGLGAAAPKGLEPDFEAKWDRDKEIISIEEYPEWIPSCRSMDIPTSEELSQWMKTGPTKLKIDDETEFCSKECIDKVLSAKSVFDELNDKDLRNARTRANPYETIKGVFFQNRAAMKTANVDAVFDWLLTNPEDPSRPNEKETGQRIPWVPDSGTDLYYFADVCAGPGGFTEYMLWKKGWNAHGFGCTLKGKDDFKLGSFLAAPSEMFEPYYGESGLEGDGDVMKPSNLLSFQNFVKKTTKDGKGVHLFMADGGFSVEGQENIQEILSKRLYLCQFLCGISILRPGGNFFCKLFDLFTPFSVGLVYLMYRIFNDVCIHKPHTSRPANSERYIVCKGLREGSSIVREYLRAINEKLDELSKKPEADQDHADVIEVVPVELMKEDRDFYEYMRDSNEKFALRQAMYLDKYRVFAKNPNLMDTRQATLREDCLKYWSIPDQLRAQPPRPSPQIGFSQLCPGEDSRPPWLVKRRGKPFSSLEQLRIVNSLSGVDFQCFVAAEEYANVILALGKHFVFQWEGTRWDMLQNHKFKLPRNTLITAELTHVYKGKGQGLQKTPLLRIVDAHTLVGVDVSALRYPERMERVRKFCNAISKENSRTDLGWIRPAEFWQLKNLQTSRFGVGKIMGADRLILYDSEPKDTTDGVSPNIPYLGCRGLYLQRTVREPWLVCKSSSTGRFYYNRPPGPWSNKPVSIFDHDWADGDDLVARYQDTQTSRLLWDWVKVKNVRNLLPADEKEEGVLSIKDVIDFVTDK